MSDYRYQIVKHNDIDCLHVMIDAEPIAETYIHIPLDDIQELMGKSYAQMVIESTAKLFEISPLTGDAICKSIDKPELLLTTDKEAEAIESMNRYLYPRMFNFNEEK